MNFVVYLAMLVVVVFVLDNIYGGFGSMWFRIYFPPEASPWGSRTRDQHRHASNKERLTSVANSNPKEARKSLNIMLLFLSIERSLQLTEPSFG